MNLVGKRILFKNKKVKEPTWGTVMDTVLVSNGSEVTITKYLVQATIKLQMTKADTSEEAIVCLVNPKHIELIE